MPNHFHFLVYIKDNLVYKYSIDQINSQDVNVNVNVNVNDAVRLEFKKWETLSKSDSVADQLALNNNKIPNPTSHFSHLFNSYTKYFNRFHGRHGALFERPFKRKQIDSDEYLKQAVIYIHNNPVHHSFVSHPIDYPWSSYLTCVSDKKI